MTSPLMLPMLLLALVSAEQPPVATAVPVAPQSIATANAVVRSNAKSKAVSARAGKLKASKASAKSSTKAATKVPAKPSAANARSRTAAKGPVVNVPTIRAQKKAARK